MKNVFLSDEIFEIIIKHSYLNSIDFIIKNKEGNYLLGLRKNDPAKDSWFVPGGRRGTIISEEIVQEISEDGNMKEILKFVERKETLEESLERIIYDELKLDYKRLEKKQKINFRQYTEHIYEENFYDDPTYNTHYIVKAFNIDTAPKLHNLPLDQHLEWRWFTLEELLSNPKVHNNTKDYFIDAPIPGNMSLYTALMAHYLHYDRQMWGRTQLLIAVQGAALTAGFVVKSTPLIPYVMFVSAFLILLIMNLIIRDIQNRDHNLPVMDKIISKVGQRPENPRLVSVRTSPKKLLRGLISIILIIAFFILLDIAIGVIFLYKPEIILTLF